MTEAGSLEEFLKEEYEEAYKEGVRLGRKEIVESMIKYGVDLERVAAVSKEPIETIREIAKSIL